MKKACIILLLLISSTFLFAACSQKSKANSNQTSLVINPSSEPDDMIINSSENLTLPTYSRKLSDREYESILSEMGIASIVIPKSFEEPYLAVDWDVDNKTADTGKSFTIGFTNFFKDYSGGWGRGYINYQTYNFSLGTEYDTFFRKEEFSTFQQNTNYHFMKVGSVTGIVKYEWNDFLGELRRIIIFPFSDHYVAVVFSLKGDFSQNHNQVIKDLYEGKYPENNKEKLIDFDNLTKSIKFTSKQ